jgi:hypothetical protein
MFGKPDARRVKPAYRDFEFGQPRFRGLWYVPKNRRARGCRNGDGPDGTGLRLRRQVGDFDRNRLPLGRQQDRPWIGRCPGKQRVPSACP